MVTHETGKLEERMMKKLKRKKEVWSKEERKKKRE
jgi:hypothetical protein